MSREIHKAAAEIASSCTHGCTIGCTMHVHVFSGQQSKPLPLTCFKQGVKVEKILTTLKYEIRILPDLNRGDKYVVLKLTGVDPKNPQKKLDSYYSLTTSEALFLGNELSRTARQISS